MTDTSNVPPEYPGSYGKTFPVAEFWYYRGVWYGVIKSGAVRSIEQDPAKIVQFAMLHNIPITGDECN